MWGGALVEVRSKPPVVVGILLAAVVVGLVAGGVVGSLATEDADGLEVDEASERELQPVELTVVSASCERQAGVDAAGNPVEFEPEFAVDGDLQSAWQCRDDGAGQSLELDLGEPVQVAELGLIPGYTKVDPHDQTEWYPLNRRLTEVRWHFDDGPAVTQVLDPDPDRRDMQTMDLAEPRETGTLTLEIVSSVPGSSDAHPNIAVSDIQVFAVSP